MPGEEGWGLFWLRHLHDLVLISPQGQLLPLLSLWLDKGAGHMMGPDWSFDPRHPSPRKHLLASQNENVLPGKEDGTIFCTDTRDRKSSCIWGRGERMIVVIPHPREKIRAVTIQPRAGRAFPVTPASCLWLSHSDGCFLGSPTLPGFWRGIGHNFDPFCAFSREYSSVSYSD